LRHPPIGRESSPKKRLQHCSSLNYDHSFVGFDPKVLAHHFADALWPGRRNDMSARIELYSYRLRFDIEDDSKPPLP
jgi:hypothetical protein